MNKFVEDYGIDLECREDKEENVTYRFPLFCVDCLHFSKCKSRGWNNCKYKKYVLEKSKGRVFD